MTDLHRSEVSHRSHKNITWRVWSLTNKAERRARTVEIYSAVCGWTRLEFLNSISSNIESIDLRQRSFGFTEIYALAVCGPSRDSRLTIVRSREAFRRSSASWKNLYHASLRPSGRVIAYLDGD